VNRLPREAARTLYNVADALLPSPPGALGFDWAAGMETCLARRGEAAARRLIGILGRLERRPLVGWRARAFSRRPRAERAARLARWAGDPRRREDHAFLLALLAEAGAEAVQSASGA
jgi:hypothetical protein